MQLQGGVRQRLLRRRRLLHRACTERLQDAAVAQRARRHLREPCGGRDAARFDDLHDDARVDLRLDGKCDGAGGCRKYPVNTMCKPGMCDGDAVVGSYACDGNGQCKPGATHICVPFSCNPASGTCYHACTTSSQCVSGQQCEDGSCGKR